MTAELICGEVAFDCKCVNAPEHPTLPHACRCGGSWTYDEYGAFVAVTFPNPEWADEGIRSESAGSIFEQLLRGWE